MSPTQSHSKERAVVRRALFCSFRRGTGLDGGKERCVRKTQEGFPAPLPSHVFQNGSVLENTPGRIIGGLGVTGHDFRGRKDLAPMSARCIRKRTGGGGEPSGPCCGRVCRYESQGSGAMIPGYGPCGLLRALWLGIFLHGPGRRGTGALQDVHSPGGIKREVFRAGPGRCFFTKEEVWKNWTPGRRPAPRPLPSG